MLTLTLVLAACGGGGDDGAGQPVPPGSAGPPAANDPPAADEPPLYLSLQHAAGALEFVDDIALVSGLLRSSAWAIRNRPSYNPVVLQCEHSGSWESSYIDNDASNLVTAGDEVVAEFSNCNGASWVARLALTQFERPEPGGGDGPTRLAGYASVSVEQALLATVRSAEFELLFESVTDSVRWRADHVAATIERDGSEHTLADGWYERLYDADGNHVTFAGSLSGQASGLPVDFSTESALSAPVGSMPVNGAMVLSAGEHSARLQPGEAAGQAVFQLLSPADEPIDEATDVEWESLLRGTPFNYADGGFYVADVVIVPAEPGAEQALSGYFAILNALGRRIESTFLWSVNGTVLEDETGNTLAASHFQAGDLVEFVVTLNNGIDTSSGTASVVISEN